MNRICIIIALSLGMAYTTAAQDTYNSSGTRNNANKKKATPKGFDPQRLVIGGGLGLGFGNSTVLGIAPIVGYRITDRFLAGVGASYYYVKQKDAYTFLGQSYDFKANVYSASVWSRFLVFDNVFAHGEYEHNFMNFTDVRYDINGSGNVESYKVKYNSPSLLLGAGYRSPITENASIVALALYDVIQDQYSPYRDRIVFRFGVNVGF